MWLFVLHKPTVTHTHVCVLQTHVYMFMIIPKLLVNIMSLSDNWFNRWPEHSPVCILKWEIQPLTSKLKKQDPNEFTLHTVMRSQHPNTH